MTQFERKESNYNRDNKLRKKPIKQFNRNGIRMISDRPERPKFFPGE